MDILIREYQPSDKHNLIVAVESLRDYITNIDSFKRSRRLSGYGKHETNNILEEIATKQGKIYIAFDGIRFLGFIAGIILQQDKEELLSKIPSHYGRVRDLFIYDKFRNKDIGKRLIKKIESYFKQMGCTTLFIEVFSPNHQALTFYKNVGYNEYTRDLIKKLD